MRKFALFASLFAWSLCIAVTNTERPNLDDPEVRKKIIEQGVVLEAVKNADGSLQYFEPLEFSPYQGSGWGVIYYENKKLHGLVQLKNGKTHGAFHKWYRSGQKKAETTFNNGKLNGLGIAWYEHGQKESEITVKNGVTDGLVIYWYKNGQKKGFTTFKNGKENGSSIAWYENGQKKWEANWKDGKKHGKVMRYDESGREILSENYKQGELVLPNKSE